MSKTKGRLHAHSNRYKRLRRFAENIAKVPNSLRAVERQVYMPIFKTKKDKDGIEHRIVQHPEARKERRKYAMEIVMIKRLQAFWIYQCPRRIYKDMKRAGI